MAIRLPGTFLLVSLSVSMAAGQVTHTLDPNSTPVIQPAVQPPVQPINSLTADANPPDPPTPPANHVFAVFRPPLSSAYWMPEHQCPGGFPSDLTKLNCSYTQRQRTLDWVSTSLSDQAILTSSITAVAAFATASPHTTWPRNSLGYLRNWRASYFSGLANGTTQYVLNSAFNFNPAHVNCRTGAFIEFEPLTLPSPSDPDYAQESIQQANDLERKVDDACKWYKRIDHVVLDTVATRKSTPDGKARLVWPSPRLAGAFAGAYGEAPWEPSMGNSSQDILTRAGESLIVPAVGALFSEYAGVLQRLTHPLHKTQLLPRWPREPEK